MGHDHGDHPRRETIQHELRQVAKRAPMHTYILDTETTGLDEDDEVIEITLLSLTEKIVYSSLVQPSPLARMKPGAGRIHGIRESDLVGSPTMIEVYHALVPEVFTPAVRSGGVTFLTWGADFDNRMIHQSLTCRPQEFQPIQAANARYGFESAQWVCLLTAFAEWYGEWSDWHQSYRRQSLATACSFFGIKQPQSHRAEADCRSTYDVLQAMLGTYLTGEAQKMMPSL